ncbi:hypothetical protein [Flavobacterium ginsenosidimutans]|uniref:YcaO domain-containing protein n=1 Tax=Flavobacterium ginsenosidimutans TaxID=687844 RepID=A0ABZ2Q6Q4_9FLAO
MDFENLFTNFKGLGIERLPTKDVAKFLTDFFDVSLYKKLRGEQKESQIFKSYNNNEDFWKDCLQNKIFAGKTIKLENFCLIEWLPYSPGLYYTKRAFNSRMEARSMMSADKNEYLPLGKMNMMLGGVGSVRLAPEKSNFYLNATSTGTSHQGIPIIVSKEVYNQFIDEIKHQGYSTVDIIGTIEILPIEKALINYAREIPKYSLVITSIAKRKIVEKEILVSVSAIYSSEPYDNYSTGHYWSFASFSPDESEVELTKAVEWIEQYALRYSNGKPKILTDFDEHKSHFNADIEFKLQNIMSGNINEELLVKYSEKFKIIINKTVMGDNIENNSGNIIKGNTGNVVATNSGDINVSNSFNKVKDKYGEDIANALIKVDEIIKKEGNEEAKEQFFTFNEELEKEQPKRSTLKALWEGIATAIPLIKSSVEIYDKVKDFIG